MPINPTDTECALTHDLWLMGRPTLAILDKGQKRWIENLRQPGKEKPNAGVWMIGRQRGKSFAALAFAAELALSQSSRVIRYAAKTAKSAESIVIPTMALILKSCPDELKPIENLQKGFYEWKNGSRLYWAGTDNDQFDRLRGPYAHLLLFDEAAFYPKLEEVESALIAQLLTTNGHMLYLSTPPESPAHPFVARYKAAERNGTACHDTIEGNPRLGVEGAREFLQSEASRLGMTYEEFRQSTYCLREFFAQIVKEETRAALPGWTPEAAAALTQLVKRPDYFDGYAGGDWGFIDGHGVLWSWWDFPNQALHIEAELLLKETNTELLANGIKRIEVGLYGEGRFDGTLRGAKDFPELPEWLNKAINDRAPKQPYLRVGDDNLLLLADMQSKHGLTFCPTRKDDKHMAVDEVDIMIRRRKLFVSPNCPQLLKQLDSTMWNKNRTEWEQNVNGHGELIDCLAYLVRNINRHKDPRPKVVDQWGINDKPTGADALRAAFRR